MTKITEQLEALTAEELKYIYDDLVEFNQEMKNNLKKSKLMIGFLRDLKDLAEAHFDNENAQIIGPNEDNIIKEKVSEIEKEIDISGKIIEKMKPLIESL